jgi:hypothetical protein
VSAADWLNGEGPYHVERAWFLIALFAGIIGAIQPRMFFLLLAFWGLIFTVRAAIA